MRSEDATFAWALITAAESYFLFKNVDNFCVIEV